jgi:hypothetical protein
VTAKPIRFSPHAEEQLRARRITRQQARTIIATGTRSPSFRGRVLIVGRIGRRPAAAVVRETAAEIRVVTVYWIVRRHRKKGPPT